MKNLFSYDSKLMTALGSLADYMILNVIFLLCCIPVVTIGAAKTALYRVMFGMLEDRGSIYKCYFKTFGREIGKGIVFTLVKGAGLCLFAWEFYVVLKNPLPLRGAMLVLLGLVILLWSMVFSNTFAQIAMFESPKKRILTNSLLIALAHPLRSLAIALMDILPLVFLGYDAGTMMQFGPIWVFFYFSVTCNLSARLLRKPFRGYAERGEQTPKEIETKAEKPRS